MLFKPRHRFNHDARSNAEGAFDHAFLANGIAGQIERPPLAFSQSAPHLKPLDRCIGCFHRLEPAHRFDQLLQLAVIRLDDVVEILDLSVFDVLRALAFLFQFTDRLGVASGFVGVDYSGLLPVFAALHSLAQKAFSRFRIARGRQVKVDGIAEFIDRSIQIRPLAPHPDIGLVNPPAIGLRPSPLPAHPALHYGSVLLHPAVNRRMINPNSALSHHSFKVAIAEPIAAIPPNGPKHDFSAEMASLEIAHGPG